MSVKISGLVWDTNLPRDLKFVALAYADRSDHDGEDVYPGKSLVCRMTGYSRRSVETITKQLLGIGVMIECGVSHLLTIRYRFDIEKLKAMATPAKSAGAQNLRAQSDAKEPAKFAGNPLRKPSVRTKLKPGLRLQTDPLGLELAAIYGRRATTAWNAKELKGFAQAKSAGLITKETVTQYAWFYKRCLNAQRPPYPRHQLETALNNWPGECDKSAGFCRRVPIPKEKPSKNGALPQQPPPPETSEETGQTRRQRLSGLRDAGLLRGSKLKELAAIEATDLPVSERSSTVEKSPAPTQTEN